MLSPTPRCFGNKQVGDQVRDRPQWERIRNYFLAYTTALEAGYLAASPLDYSKPLIMCNNQCCLPLRPIAQALAAALSPQHGGSVRASGGRCVHFIAPNLGDSVLIVPSCHSACQEPSCQHTPQEPSCQDAPEEVSHSAFEEHSWPEARQEASRQEVCQKESRQEASQEASLRCHVPQQPRMSQPPPLPAAVREAVTAQTSKTHGVRPVAPCGGAQALTAGREGSVYDLDIYVTPVLFCCTACLCLCA